MVEAFSITQTEISGLSCLSRMAKARPAGPAPTVTTSYSMTSRSIGCHRLVMGDSACGWLTADGIVAGLRQGRQIAGRSRASVRRMALSALPLADAELAFDPHWLGADAAPTRCSRHCASSVAWEVHRIRLFGREVDSPRLSCWIGDPDAAYRYSGTRFEPRPWPRGAAAGARAAVRASSGSDFNSVLANLYRDGRDAWAGTATTSPSSGRSR